MRGRDWRFPKRDENWFNEFDVKPNVEEKKKKRFTTTAKRLKISVSKRPLYVYCIYDKKKKKKVFLTMKIFFIDFSPFFK